MASLHVLSPTSSTLITAFTSNHQGQSERTIWTERCGSTIGSLLAGVGGKKKRPHGNDTRERSTAAPPEAQLPQADVSS